MIEANTLPGFLRRYLDAHHMSNRKLAKKAAVSESAIRNMLKFGIDPRARKPDAITLFNIATAIQVNPIILFELAGYLPIGSRENSPYAKYIADLFDSVNTDDQEAIIRKISEIMNGTQNAQTPVLSP